MSTEVRSLHNAAMRAAEEGLRLRSTGRLDEAAEAMRSAYRLEEQAAMLLLGQPESEPSRGILFRSAASLAIEAAEFRAAERLVCIGLGGNPTDEIQEELRETLEQVYFRRHLDTRGIVLLPEQLQMALAGDAIALGMAETHEFQSRLIAAEKLLIRTGERMHHVPYRAQGVIPSDTRDRFAMFVSPPRTGSFTVTLQIGGVQRGLFREAEGIVDELLTCFDLWQADNEAGLRQRIPQEDYRRNFDGFARVMAPDGERVRFVGLTAHRGDRLRTVQVTRPIRRVARSKGNKEPSTVTLRGELREASALSRDPSKHRIVLVPSEGDPVPVRVQSGHEEVVKQYFGSYVELSAEKAKARDGGGWIYKEGIREVARE